MKNLPTYEEFVNEGFLQNVKDAVKNKDPYHIFKSKESFQNRTKFTFELAKKLLDVSKEKGMIGEIFGKDVWVAKDDKTDTAEWHFDPEGYIYYKDEYRKEIEDLKK